MTTNNQLNNALDELERKINEKVTKLVGVHEILGSLIQSSIGHSNDILSVLKDEVAEIKNNSSMMNNKEMRNTTDNQIITCDSRPEVELKDQPEQSEKING